MTATSTGSIYKIHLREKYIRQHGDLVAQLRGDSAEVPQSEAAASLRRAAVSAIDNARAGVALSARRS